ncbi:hypothetical protein GYMLUDRAFT_85119 [Collybiopsis luxurians FD-317 M1]|uniref:O-methyltransferase C-terminal domain-containing protein n=1 Tax=Collybiopsis luxurians FD-317 M1 TaxID=944289 RepID=A0A0D0BZ49_9AGAR|nr:hypothetical protein GYMLUDRAFT_85119 [Collybiopsis luxurians FD-317 M1]
MASLRQLIKIMEEQVCILEKLEAEDGKPLPDLYMPYSTSSEAFRQNVASATAAKTACAAAFQLVAILNVPQVSLYHAVGGHYRSSAIRACLESHVTEILREAGPKGLHVNFIAAKNKQDPAKLGRFLRYLSIHHIYREISPDVFTNTRISSLLDTGKQSAELIANPLTKYDNTDGLAALASHHLDESFKASAYSWEALSNPGTAFSQDPTQSPFCIAHNTSDTKWEYYDRPDQSYRRNRFAVGMRGVQALQPPNAILDIYDWGRLSSESVIVDIGAGIGMASLAIAENFPKLKFIIQDVSPGVIKEGHEMWMNRVPDMLNKGNVQFQVHNFFDPQLKENMEAKPSIFILKQVLHDWSDKYALQILSRLRDVAGLETTILIIDTIIPLGCRQDNAAQTLVNPSVPSTKGNENMAGIIEDHPPVEAPAPLLLNFGAVNEVEYMIDMQMFHMFNSQERTLIHFQKLLLKAGWRIRRVNRREGANYLQCIEAVPM